MPFTEDFLARVAAALAARMAESAARRVRDGLTGGERQQAFGRCVQAGVVALLATASAETPEEADLLSSIFEAFLGEADTARALNPILHDQPPDLDELRYLFEHVGYESQTLPGLDFGRGIAAFEAAFLSAAVGEPALQGTIQASQAQAQTRLQRELLAAVQPDWETHYLQTLISRCYPLDLTPIDETRSQTGPAGQSDVVRVSDVFTTLYLDGLTSRPKQPIAEAIKWGLTPPQPYWQERVPIQAVEAVGALPRLVVLGQPGGGKSTLVNYLVTQLAKRRLPESGTTERLADWPTDDKPLPVRIILRHFAAWLPAGAARGAAGMVWDYLEHQLAECGCRDAFAPLRRILIEEGGVIFFDGLDEVRETDEAAKRTLIKEAIAGFAAPLANCRVVVTCREYAYRRGDAWRLPEADFPVVELALFHLEQVAAFTQLWYRVVGPQKGWNEQKCQSEADNLIGAIRAWPHLHELARYPLLLTLMAQVHGRDGYLPRDRADLYERAVNLLLAHWENRIEIDVHGGRRVEPGLVLQLGIRTDTLRAALEQVAFNAHERQQGEEARRERAANTPREELTRALLAAGLEVWTGGSERPTSSGKSCARCWRLTWAAWTGLSR